MRKLKLFWAGVAFLGAAFMVMPLAGAEEMPLAVTVFHPLQLPDETFDVGVLRLNLFYGVNSTVHFIDLGVINKTTVDQGGFQFGVVNLVDGYFHGWQEGLVNIVGGDFVGFQDGVFNSVHGNFTGWQNGTVNITGGDLAGIQTGLWNQVNTTATGLQLGLVNIAGGLSGFQVGVLNFNKSKDPLGFFPVINFSF
ncbi:MAG: hypothetical protein HQL20_08310 [Candidatus Omnitrophica bacterium]|nr:hypothetical protein [Candidatus Omnitrophota bacterium]